MLHRLIFTLLLLFSFLPGKAQYKQLLHKPHAKRFIYIDSTFYNNQLVKLDSGQMFAILDKIGRLALENDDEELYLETRLMHAFYYIVRDWQKHAKGERLLLNLRDIADEKEILQLQIRIRDKLGYYYYYLVHKPGPAFENYLQVYQLSKKIPDKELPDKQELIANIGSAYFNFGDTEKAKEFFDEAQKLPPTYRKRFAINLQNTLGLIYRTEKNFTEAERNFRKAYAMAEASQDSTWMGITAGNIGIAYYQQQKYQEAIPLLKLDVEQSFKAGERDNGMGSLIILLKIYQHYNNNQQLDALLKLARKQLPHTASPHQHLKELYPILARQSANAGNMYQAYRYTDSASMVKDTLADRRNSILMARAEQKAALERHKAEVMQLENKEMLQRLWLVFLTVGVLLVTIIAFLTIKRQRSWHQEKQQQLASEKERVELALQQAAFKLQDFTQRIREKNKLIERITADLKKAETQPDNPASDNNKTALQQLQQATILTDDQCDEFRQIFEQVHVGYLQRLKEKVGTLSPAEMRFMALSKLGLTNKEMAAMLGISTEAIRLTRHRLRKKLHLSENRTIEELIAEV